MKAACNCVHKCIAVSLVLSGGKLLPIRPATIARNLWLHLANSWALPRAGTFAYPHSFERQASAIRVGRLVHYLEPPNHPGVLSTPPHQNSNPFAAKIVVSCHDRRLGTCYAGVNPDTAGITHESPPTTLTSFLPIRPLTPAHSLIPHAKPWYPIPNKDPTERVCRGQMSWNESDGHGSLSK